MLVRQVVPEFCYPKLVQKLCVGICMGGAWVEVASSLNDVFGEHRSP